MNEVAERTTPIASQLAAVLYLIRDAGTERLSAEKAALLNAALQNFELQPDLNAAPSPRKEPDGTIVERELRYLVRLPGWYGIGRAADALSFVVSAPSAHVVWMSVPTYTDVVVIDRDVGAPGVDFRLPEDWVKLDAHIRESLAKSAPADAVGDALDQAAALIEIMCNAHAESMSDRLLEVRRKVAAELREILTRHRFGRALGECHRRRLLETADEPSKMDVERIFALMHLPSDASQHS